jgi:hypothetical protein
MGFPIYNTAKWFTMGFGNKRYDSQLCTAGEWFAGFFPMKS